MIFIRRLLRGQQAFPQVIAVVKLGGSGKLEPMSRAWKAAGLTLPDPHPRGPLLGQPGRE
jgi:hypothetical protein